MGHGRKLKIVRELVSERSRVVSISKMERVSIFLDGPYRMLRARLGDEVSFERSKQPLQVIGLDRRGGKKPR